MKKNVIIITLLILGAVFFLFTQKKSNQPMPNESKEAKFFQENKFLPSDTVIKIISTGFDPAEVTVKKGSRVVWLNQTTEFSWPASNLHPTHGEYPEFDPLEPFKQSEAWGFVFDKAGDWEYHNHLKPNQRGIVHVNN